MVLMLITSAGIYGFLTAAYQKTSDQLTVIDKQTELFEMKKDRYQEQLNAYVVEKEQLTESISELSKGLSNNVIQYTDKETGQIITTTSSSTRRVLEKQLTNFREEKFDVSKKIETFTDSVTSLDIQILEITSNNELAAEIGPLRYLSTLTNIPMNKVVNWFTLLIVFVFDPMAVAMVIALNKYIDDGKSHNELTKEDVKVILEANENPPEPNENLKKAANKYKEVVSDGASVTDATTTISDDKTEFYNEPPKKKGYSDGV